LSRLSSIMLIVMLSSQCFTQPSTWPHVAELLKATTLKLKQTNSLADRRRQCKPDSRRVKGLQQEGPKPTHVCEQMPSLWGRTDGYGFPIIPPLKQRGMLTPSCTACTAKKCSCGNHYRILQNSKIQNS
jgi:hypothetical protein